MSEIVTFGPGQGEVIDGTSVQVGALGGGAVDGTLAAQQLTEQLRADQDLLEGARGRVAGQQFDENGVLQQGATNGFSSAGSEAMA